MTTDTLEQDPLDYVRQRLQAMNTEQQTRLALDTKITPRTIYNVIKGERDAKHSTVMKLYKALKDAAAAEVPRP